MGCSRTFILVLLSLSSWQQMITCLLLPASVSSPSKLKSNTTMEFLQKTLNSLDLTMIFFRHEHRNVNLDTVIGTRIVEASMNIILDRLEASDLMGQVPEQILDRITKLRDESSQISNITAPFILMNQPDYFAKIGPILRPGLFQLNYESRLVAEEDLVWPYNQDEVMKEDQSDDCLAEVFGTSTGGSVCDISQKCWQRMTNLGYNVYSLSHEIFYLEIAEGFGCGSEMFSHALLNHQPSVELLHEVFCTNMLAEAKLIALAEFPMRYQDLFMEQAALCGILGYREFFQSDWLSAILSWQDVEDGCYKWDGWPEETHTDSITTVLHGRSKREEQRVSEGCLCHRTSVAASALAQYTRYILESWLEERGLPRL